MKRGQPRTFIGWLLTISLCAGEAAALPIRSSAPIARRWAAPSRIQPSDAAKALYLEAVGEAVSPEDLFEAEKLLRSDGPVSPNEYVLDAFFTRLLHHRLGAARQTTKLRTPPPVLHWLAGQAVRDGVEIRGETVQLAIAEPSAGSVVLVLRHRRIHHLWTSCGDDLCVTSILEPSPRDLDYLWSVTSGTTIYDCGARAAVDGMIDVSDPLPDERYGLACGSGAASEGLLRLTYTVGRSVATPPRRASASAVVNNPLEVRLAE